MLKRFISISAAAAAMIVLIMMFGAAESFAEDTPGDLAFDKDTINMDVEMPADESDYFLKKKDGTFEFIKGVTSSVKGIVYIDSAFVYEDGFDIQPMGVGTTVLTVTGDQGSTVNVTVTVGTTALYNTIKNLSETLPICYGQKTIQIRSIAGANYTLKIGKDKYTGTMPNRELTFVEKKVKLKKFYNPNTKITLKVTKNGTPAATYTDKFGKDTDVLSLKASGKRLKVRVYNLHKGDTVKIKIGKKTYKKKIKKSYHHKNYTVTIKAKKKIKKNEKITFDVRTKSNKKLDKKTCKLKKGRWVRPED